VTNKKSFRLDKHSNLSQWGINHKKMLKFENGLAYFVAASMPKKAYAD
jgi:hypothetical protein